MEYNYPIDYDWSTEEIIAVTAFYAAVEKAYESGIVKEELMNAYRGFKGVVPSMAEEKTIFKQFEEASGYNSYRIVKEAKQGTDGETIKGAQR